MKRGIILNNGQCIHISDGEVWMTTWELTDLFYTTSGAIHIAIKRILKANVLKSHEACKYIKLENGNNADVYNLDMVIALSYQIDTGHSAVFRKWLADSNKRRNSNVLQMEKNENKPKIIHTDKEIAKMAGVGTGTVARFNKVMNSDDEDIKQRVLSGETSISAGYKELV